MGSFTRNPNLDLDLTAPEASLRRSAGWWTGPDPAAPDCPGRGQDGWLRALPMPNLATCTRTAVLDYFANGWVLTEALFSALSRDASFYVAPYHGLRHPLIFYYVHPAVLYINKLRVAGLLADPIHPYFERLFETGVDEMSWDDMSKNELAWPDLASCTEYRRRAFAVVRALITDHPDLAPGHAPITAGSPLWALFMGLEHERIHLETSSVLMREMALSHLCRPAHLPPPHPAARPYRPGAAFRAPQAGVDFPDRALARVTGGPVCIGKPADFATYGWDNEYGARTVEVADFAAGQDLVSNGEYYAFVQAGGYAERRFWSEEGWRWRTFRNVKWPTFWVPCGPQGSHHYALRTLFDIVEMPWFFPAIVNFHEARAYANWRSAVSGRPLRLLTEAEQHRLRAVAGDLSPDGAGLPGGAPWCHSLRHGSEAPVGEARAGGWGDVFGNTWQWLEDPFHALPGFTVHPCYDDFSTPCFDGHHQMIVGGSFISAGDEATVHARFHFRPHFFQHAGLRLCDPLRPDNDGAIYRRCAPLVDPIEHDLPRAAHADFLGGRAALPRDLTVPLDDADDLIALCAAHGAGGGPGQRTLDVGCGLGGLAYRLSARFATVLALDSSPARVRDVQAWVQGGVVLVQGPDDAAPVGLPLMPERIAQVEVRHAGAGALPAELADFDLVVARRVLSLLPAPRAFLGRLGGARGLVRPGGHLLVADSFVWEADRTMPALQLAPEDLGAALGHEFTTVAEGRCYHIERPGPAQVRLELLRYSLWRRC